MRETPAGAMLSVPLSQEELLPLLPAAISMAALNTPSLSILSGPRQEVEAFEKKLAAEGHECITINFPRASHSPMMEPIREMFAAALNLVKKKAPQIPPTRICSRQ